MHIGHYISGAGHIGLIGWLLFGTGFATEPLPFEVTNVSVVTSEDFAALVDRAQPPESTVDVEAPAVPEPITPEVPEAPAQPDPEPVVDPIPEPEPAPVPNSDTAPVPDVTPPAPPLPEPEPLPAVEPAPVLPPVAKLPRGVRPVPRPAPRVATIPVEAPEPDATVAQETQTAVTPEPDQTAAEVEPEKETTAPEEAATEIVTEAEDEPANSPLTSSLRPQARPSRPSAEPDKPSRSDAVADALAQALAGGTTTPEPDVPIGPPLSAGEVDGLRLSVQACWVVDVGSQAANVTVTVAISLDRDGRVKSNSIKLVSSSGGTGGVVDSAFNSARRAILRCQEDGYELPTEKYDQWKDIEMTFNPEMMRLR